MPFHRYGNARSKPLLVGLGLLALIALAAWRFGAWERDGSPARAIEDDRAAAEVVSTTLTAETNEANQIEFPQSSWQAVSLQIEPVETGPIAQTIELTGKIALNEERIAHIFPLVEGRVDAVKIQLGDKVEQGQLLVVVQSKEVGQAMLQLFQDRLQLDFMQTKDRWMQTVAENTHSMIKLIREGASIMDIERQLTNKPVGEYRETLMSAYIADYKATMHYERLAPLAQDGAVTGRQLLEAEAEQKAARATLQSLVEQIHQDVQQASAVSAQAVKELQTRVSVGETNLKILGFEQEELEQVNPTRQGEEVSHYPIHAPFAGTIISKDVVLLERVGPESQILGIADLSTVWVTADIYEEQLPLLQKLDNTHLRVHSKAWPQRTFEAEIFYAGDLVNESSRTLTLRAIADNTEELLKPGMFVTIELSVNSGEEVVQVPVTALQEHEGKTFVYLHLGGDRFERRDVQIGRRNAETVEIVAGIERGAPVVVGGGFALKSRMLADLLTDD